MPQIRFYIVDVFAPRKYSGNQLAVFLDLEQQLSSDEMLQITREVNFAESAFIRSLEENGSFGVRIFTTEYEVPFAGHPTLGTAYVIGKELLGSTTDEVVLKLEKGAIPVQISKPDDLDGSRFTMQQAQPDFGPVFDPKSVADALNLSLNEMDSYWPIQMVDTGLPYLIIFLKDLNAIQDLKLNAKKVTQFLRVHKLHKETSSTGLTTSLFFVTKETVDDQHQYHARMFVLEGDSLWEDAATGSANGCLLAYLLKVEKPSQSAIVEQGHRMGRRSVLYLEGERNKNEYIIKVGGQVVPIATGFWSV